MINEKAKNAALAEVRTHFADFHGLVEGVAVNMASLAIEAYEAAREKPVKITTLPARLGKEIYSDLLKEANIPYPPIDSKQWRVSRTTNCILGRVMHFWPNTSVRQISEPEKAEAVDVIAEKQASGWEYGTHARDKAQIVLSALLERFTITRKP